LASWVEIDSRRLGWRRWIQGRLQRLARQGEVDVALRFQGRTFRLAVRVDDLGDYAIFGETIVGSYPPPEGFTPDRIVDAGANIGLFALHARAAFPGAEIVCYEPNAENLARLRRHLSRNGVEADIKECGCWSHTTTLYFHRLASHTGFVDAHPPGDPIPCALPEVTADTWLKLDVEGAEYEVVPALLAQGMRPRFISMEIHSNRAGHRPSDLARLLEAHGYRTNKPVRDDKPDQTISAVRVL
jgi:FkbM family methyltransferase